MVLAGVANGNCIQCWKGLGYEHP